MAVAALRRDGHLFLLPLPVVRAELGRREERLGHGGAGLVVLVGSGDLLQLGDPQGYPLHHPIDELGALHCRTVAKKNMVGDKQRRRER